MLILLADTRKKLLWLWIGATAVLVLLVLVQTLNGIYEDIEGAAWSWVFVHLIPALLLLFIALLLNKNPSKVLPHATFQALYLGSLAYLLLMLISLLALPLAMRSQSIESYLSLTYYWLLPFQGLLLIAFAMLYFRKETFFRPSAAIMKDYVSKKEEFARRRGSLLQIQSFDLLIQEDGLSKTLVFLSNNDKNNLNDLILLQNQYANWKKQRDLNLIAPGDLQRELNRMTLATIDFIENL